MTKLGENLNKTLQLQVPGLNTQLQSFVPTFSKLPQISYSADKEKTKVNQFEKFNNFLENNPWGSTISAGINIAGSLIKQPPGYSGKYGALQSGLDNTYNAIAKGVKSIPKYGQTIGLIMDAAGVLNKGIQRLGGGTDGMTTADSILNSNLFGWNIGLINGIGGKKANSYTRNQELDAASGAGFGGFQALQNTTQVGAGKKYGLFSSGARHKQDKLTEYTQGVKHSISGIVDTNTLNNLASQTSSPYATAQFQMDLNGGMQNLRAARKGMKFPIIKLPKFKQKFYDPFKATLGEDWEEMYDADGVRTAIPSTLSTAQKQGLAPIPTKRGGIVYMKPDGSFSDTPLRASLYAKNGGQFVKNVISKYQAGNSLRRSVQVFDVATNKYVQIEIPLNKDQIAGRQPIRLANGTAVFMNGDGTVTSDRWETLGRREHLTPKGQDGIKVENQLLNTKVPTNLQLEEITPYGIKFDKENNRYVTSIDNNSTKQQKKNLEDYINNNPKFKGWRIWEDYYNKSGKYYILPKEKADKLDWEYIESLQSGKSTGGHILGQKYRLKDSGKVIYKLENPYINEQGEEVTHIGDDGSAYVSPDPEALEPIAYKNGGQMNVIPEGALHARKNHLTEVDDIYKQVTHKGIPVITIEDDGEVVQHAEVEHSEIIFTKEVTDKMENYRKQGTDEAAIECGKMLVKEILYNTDDRSGVIQTVE